MIGLHGGGTVTVVFNFGSLKVGYSLLCKRLFCLL